MALNSLFSATVASGFVTMLKGWELEDSSLAELTAKAFSAHFSAELTAIDLNSGSPRRD